MDGVALNHVDAGPDFIDIYIKAYSVMQARESETHSVC